ncbi:Ribosomal protein S12p Asp88 (E. coli) methylthiotransferase (EC [Olavius algarvensis associated proteobacterium Delta 3]|nr:Ribosomal protein S12p Asp88 (E. coli) methylthiotransferase (EC [Olavius algarvensis associated proteobacterium Delta 3]
MNVHFVSLGCARNQVDSETMMGRLQSAGWVITQEPADAEVIVVNTCSFIEPAVDESIDTILALANYKKTGVCRRLIVAGCLPERYRADISGELPEVDVFLGTGAFDKIIDAASEVDMQSACLLPAPGQEPLRDDGLSRLRPTPHMAYVKIAEGCSRSCTYCVIPKLRGSRLSRMPDNIVNEVQLLLQSGVRELVLVAQDTTAYGRDLEPASDLASLLTRIESAARESNQDKTPPWIRFLYGHPESIGESVLETVASLPAICPYFDIPVQHAADHLLKRMGRHYCKADLIQLFERIRSTVPGAALRTTVIVGFPGESDEDAAELKEFVEHVRFDHLGIFRYSDSEDLPSHRLPNHVSTELAEERYHTLMAIQADISRKTNEKYIGETLRVLVEEKPEENLFIGRTAFQAPEVDGITYINASRLDIGTFTNVTITDSYEYDLVGEPA